MKQDLQDIILLKEYMNILEFPAEKAVVRRYMEDLWIPYYRELETIVDAFALADDYDLMVEGTEDQLNRLERKNCRTWIAIDGSHDADNLADSDGEFVGFIMTLIDEAPAAFDHPDRLIICEIYVREPYRGTGLANELVDYARRWARENELSEFKLDVDVDNERAIAFYEKFGFEPSRYSMVANVEE